MDVFVWLRVCGSRCRLLFEVLEALVDVWGALVIKPSCFVLCAVVFFGRRCMVKQSMPISDDCACRCMYACVRSWLGWVACLCSPRLVWVGLVHYCVDCLFRTWQSSDPPLPSHPLDVQVLRMRW